MTQRPQAIITLTSGEQIRMDLYPEQAPNTVNSFIWLANQGAFNNRMIKRIVPGFVLQPSFNSFDEDPICDYMIKGEFKVNGYDNNLPLTPYTVVMGGDGVSLASGSCFFITVADCEERLGGKYPGFGLITSGFEVVDRVVSVPLKSVPADIPGVVVNEPEKPEIIESIIVETFGTDYPAPEKTTGVWAYEKAQIVPGQKYRHFKGNEYEILHIAKHSETMEELVVYRALYGEFGIWVRPLEMFAERIERDGKKIKRFTKID